MEADELWCAELSVESAVSEVRTKKCVSQFDVTCVRAERVW